MDRALPRFKNIFFLFLNKVEDGVARAVRLAANLSNQLFVDLPPEQPRSGGAEAAASNERKGRPGNKKTRENSNREGQQHRRKHKSLSPEKRLASTLAQSMSSISKSFEKLDLIGKMANNTIFEFEIYSFSRQIFIF